MTLPWTQSLKGIRVIDASRVLAGPFAAQTLSDLGAEVIKVEHPQGGDDTRKWGPPFVGSKQHSAYFLAANRGKRGIALDLMQPEGQQILEKLLAKSDILIENFRSDSLSRLGLEPDLLLKNHPHLIICSISGFGREGAYAHKPGYDFVVQGLSGMMAKTGPVDGMPFKVGVAITDIVTGLYSSTAILACLHRRAIVGHGFHIDLALLDCAVASMANVAQAFLSTGKEPVRQGNAHLQIVPYEAFPTKDGWLILAIGNDLQWRRFTTMAHAPSLGDDPLFATNPQRLAHRDKLIPILAQILRQRSTAEWLEVLDRAQVPAGPVWTMKELFESDLAKERGLKLTIRGPDGQMFDFVRSPFASNKDPHQSSFPPCLGEHTRSVLEEVLAMPPQEIDRLKDMGVIA